MLSTEKRICNLHICLFIVLTLASLMPIWATEHFPSQNGPWFLLTAHMMREYSNPQWNYAEYYEFNWHAMPHVLHTLLMYGFAHAAPILIAQKMALTVYVILLPLSIFYFLSGAAPDKKVLGYFAFLMIHNYTFYRGYHNFSLSIPLFFFTFGYWIRHRENVTKWCLLALAVLVSLLYLSHVFGFLLIVCAIGWYRLVEMRSISKAFRSVLTATWPGWLMLVNYVVLNLRSSTWVDYSEAEWLLPHTSMEYFFRKFFYTTSMPVYLIGVAAFLWIVYLLGRRFVGIGRRGREGLRKAVRDPLLTMIVVMALAYFIVPWKFLGWHYVSVRLVPFIIGLALACVGRLPAWHRGFRFQPVFLATVCAAALGIDVLMTREVIRLEQPIQQYTSGISSFEPNSTLLPIHLENPRFGQIRPLTRAHEYYHIQKGGVNGVGIAARFNTLVPLWYRTYPVEETLPGFDPEAPEQSMKQIAKVYDYVLVWGTDNKLAERLERFAFRPVHENGKLHLYRKEAPAKESAADHATGRWQHTTVIRHRPRLEDRVSSGGPG